MPALSALWVGPDFPSTPTVYKNLHTDPPIMVSLNSLDCAVPSVYIIFMQTTYSIREAQANFPALVRGAEEHTITITRHDRVAGYVVSAAKMEGLIETLEILSNPRAVQAIESYEAGNTPFVDLAELGDD